MLLLEGAEASGKRIGPTKSSRLTDDDDQPQSERVLCPNCKQIFGVGDMVAHTVVCYRNSTKCKLCGEVVLKDRKKEHLAKWRDLEVSLYILTAAAAEG